MFDGAVKRRLDPVLAYAAARLHPTGISANAATGAAFGIGLGGAVAIAGHLYGLGLVLILFSRLFDGIDGALARRTEPTDFGGYLDIVLDFVFYGAVPLGFALADPPANALPAAVLLFSFYANGSSFLAFAVMAEKRGLSSDRRGPKSLYFTTGLAEAGETLLAFALACFFPHWFATIAFVFAVMCLVTCASRVALAAILFR